MNRQGYSILEAVVAMSIFAVGMLALSQSYFGVMRAQVAARNHELATQCARDRLEEIVNAVSYATITEGNFPDEDYGAIDAGDPKFEQFARTVAIDDSLNAINQSVLKEVTVRVSWQTVAGTRDVTLNTVVARYRDVQL
jgi:type II secretory pathway pseudopilin PulG